MDSIQKRFFSFVIVLVSLCIVDTSLFSEKKINLDNAEKTKRKEKLKKLNIKSFVNRNNERADEKTRLSEFETGVKLSTLFKNNPESTIHKGIYIKRFDSKVENLLGGDVMEFSKNISYGHINAIVRVVSGYISNMFEYNKEDSELLALYVIYYNRKHRGNMDYLHENFAENNIIKQETLGIPEKFVDWRGQTQILIPIEKNLAKGGGFDIATFELEDQVNPDIDANNQNKFAKLQNKKIKSEKEEIQSKLDNLEKKEKKLLDRKAEIESKLAELKKDPEKNKDEIARLEKEKIQIDKELTLVANEKKELKEKMDQITRREEMRKLGITSEKEYLAYLESQKKKNAVPESPAKIEVIEEAPKPIVEVKPIVETKTVSFTYINPPEDVNFWQSYQLNENKIVAGRESYHLPTSQYITIGYELPYHDKTELKLFLINSTQEKILKDSTGILLNTKSPLAFFNNKIYVIEVFNGMNYLSQLNSNLDLELRSSHPIHENSSIELDGNNIKVSKVVKTGALDDILFFNMYDLRLVQ